MEKRFSSILASGLTLLTLSGFVKRKKPKHLLGLMNIDTQHSILRLPLILVLLGAGSQETSLRNTRAILTFVGVFYLAIGSLGAADRRLDGVLPSKLTNFDLAYHFGVGILALWLGRRSVLTKE
jgi:hypothetical protein